MKIVAVVFLCVCGHGNQIRIFHKIVSFQAEKIDIFLFVH